VQLRARARDWPAIVTTRPDDTGGWWQDGLLITYADRSNAQHSAIVESFRVDFDGTRVLAARVASEHIQEGSFFSLEGAEGDDPVESLPAGRLNVLMPQPIGSAAVSPVSTAAVLQASRWCSGPPAA